MYIPLFFPVPSYQQAISRHGAIPLRELCAAAGVPCRASGAWTEREIILTESETPAIIMEPGAWGAVCVHIPTGLRQAEATRYALAALAYGAMDLVARESIRGAEWAKPHPPRGRPATGRAKTSQERQRAFRMRHRQP